VDTVPDRSRRLGRSRHGTIQSHQKEMNPNVASLIRHILTAAGGFLVAKGIASAEQIAEIVGALITVVGIGWSIKKNGSSNKTE
jgi:hypothetical protein